MGMWVDAQNDVAEILECDGEQVLYTPQTGRACQLRALWEGESSEGDDLSGPAVWVATTELPDGTIQGGTITYPAVGGTAYTVSTRNDDGHGLTRLILTNEAEI